MVDCLRIHELSEEKFDGRQKLLAEKLNKSEAEISKMLNGVQYFTLNTIAKLEWAFGAKIIADCTNNSEADFVQVKTPPEKGYMRIILRAHHLVEEQFDRVVVRSAEISTEKTIYFAS